MINLLPPDEKQAKLYGRRNTRLLRWLAGSLLGVAGIFVVTAFGLLFMNVTINSYKSRIAGAEEQLKVQKLEETQKAVQEMSDSFKLSTQVLSKQVLFSKLIENMGTVMPTGTALSGLTITSLQGGLDLNALAINRETATQIQVNLEDPKNKLFDKVDIVSITCSPENQAQFGYACQIQLKARFATGNQFLLIPPKTEVKQ
ncbi:MAG: hypothetical protein AAB459_02855 [Patescibacteria group bacterium]